MPTRHDRRRSADRPDAIAKTSTDPEGALADVETADAAYGTVPLELLARAKKLCWIGASAPGSAVLFYDAPVKSDFVLTGMHDT